MPLMVARQKIACSAVCFRTVCDVATQPRGSAERCAATLSMIEGKTGKKRNAKDIGKRCVHSLPWSSS